MTAEETQSPVEVRVEEVLGKWSVLVTWGRRYQRYLCNDRQQADRFADLLSTPSKPPLAAVRRMAGGG